MQQFDYFDSSNAISIEEYSKKLIGKSFKDILNEYFGDTDEFIKMCERYDNPRRKGSLGNLIEEFFFRYQPNNIREADFPEAGVELKVMPYEKLSNGRARAGERLVIGMIPNNMPVPDSFEQSYVFNKLNLILLILYLREKSQRRIEHRIDYARLFSMSSIILEKDYEIIKSDYEIIIKKIKSGKAHELSESDTMYLGACTKGASASKSLQAQYYNSKIPAKRRAFSLKQGYMTSIINDYITKEVALYDTIVKEKVNLNEFEKIVARKILKYKGKNENELRKQFGLKNATSKDIFNRLTMAMLGVKSNSAEEFIKSNTIVKTIRLEHNGKVKESMSFPAIKFKEFVSEEWEDSLIYEYFTENRFLFVIYKNYGKELLLEDVQFWHMPLKDLEGVGYEEWFNVQQIIKNGVKLTPLKSTVANNLPKKSNTQIFHLRPHASKSAYLINGIKYGNGVLKKDADELPNGDMMTRQSFWLNNDYILKQLEK